ncbi:MAG: hypothetical protein LW832_01150 [Parachlamydia sp.]|jgi:hypothetical protein|nr:hypothetical protein [Parachlamydia sp.]
MFNRNDVNVIKTLLIPPLEILASPEYQERIWVNNPSLEEPYYEIFEVFFEISRTLLSHGEEYQLDEKNRESLKELHEMVYNFYTYKILDSDDDIQLFLNQPDWVKIQGKARDLVDALRPIVATRQQYVIESELIPSIAELANPTYQKQNWTSPDNKYAYSNWFINFSEICNFWLLPTEESLKQKNKQHLYDLFKKVDEFDDEWGKIFGDNISALINHPDWIKIQNQAADLLEMLKYR